MRTPRFSDCFAPLCPPEGAADASFAARFARMADFVLSRVSLVAVGGAGEVVLRPTEVECYFSGGAHLDPFAHRDPVQQSVGAFYFHRLGGTYKGGTYKGCDVTFGRPGEFGGLLFRAVEIEPARGGGGAGPGERVEGPSLLVDRLLAITGCTAVAALAEACRLVADEPSPGDPPSPLFLRVGDVREGVSALACARVGMSLRTGDLDEKRRYLARPYRFVTDPARTRKGRPQIVSSLHAAGRTLDEIARITGARPDGIARLVDAYERGRRERDLAPLARDPSPLALCRALGACS